MDVQGLHNLLNSGQENGVFPCCSAAVGTANGEVLKHFGGYRALYPEREILTDDTLFDMASLSKLMGTTFAALRFIDKDLLTLESKVGDFFDDCNGKENITVYQLMTHTSGIKAHFPIYLRGIQPEDAVAEIFKEEFGYKPESDAVYSCMGYILLGKIIEKIANRSLDDIVSREVFHPLGMTAACYCPTDKICASTERDLITGEIINGVVHDENARFLNGVAGNAGIFCDMDGCIKFAEMLLRRGDGYISRSLFDLAVTDHTPRFSERRGLGFQHVGRLVGHNGFTGTSLYCDLDLGVYAILLTNRVHPSRDNHKLMPFRREFHRLVFGD